jgi:hypothetical protein
MSMREKLIWVAALAIIAGVFYVSGDGFYRYPCQDPLNWTDPSCQPPVCSANKTCPADLVGELHVP